MRFTALNLFQRTALQWDRLAPYNAGQIMRLSAGVDPEQVSRAWQRMLLELCLGKAQLCGRRYRHLPFASPVQVLAADADIENFVAAQMNTPFDLEHEGPFRAFLLPHATGPRLGIIYHHWMADSFSVRLLLREWFYRLTPAGEPRTAPFPLLPDQSPSGMLRHLPSSIAALWQWAVDVKAVRRSKPEAMENYEAGYRVVRLPDGTAAQLHTIAHNGGLKVTDLLLCSLARTCHKHLPAVQLHRPALALGSIRDLRSPAGNSGDHLGVSLGFNNMICPTDLLEDRSRLLKHIARISQWHRTPAAVHASRLELRLALALSNWCSPGSMREFYRKRMPLSGGLSNVDLTHSWVLQHHPHAISEFFRASPVGPMLPVVITPTTLGSKFNIAITWRTSLFTRENSEAFIETLLEDLATWPAWADPAPLRAAAAMG
jgi:hypothetical protein